MSLKTVFVFSTEIILLYLKSRQKKYIYDVLVILVFGKFSNTA